MSRRHVKLTLGSIAYLTFVLFAPPTSTSAQPAAKLQERVVQFETATYWHGLPYEEARNLGPEAIPILRRLLNDEAFKEHWTNVATTIAYIGDPSGFAILRSFIWERFKGEVDPPTFRALLISQGVMGAISGPEAVDYLVSGTDPAFWKGIPWTCEHNRGSSLQILLSKLSINGLSLTGSPRAGAVLEQLKRSPFSERQRSNIDEGLSKHKEIVARGQHDFLRSHNH